MSYAKFLLFGLLALPVIAAPFSNDTVAAGIEEAPAGRAQLIDVNQDGWPDLCVGGENSALPGSYRVFLNCRGQRFVEATASTGLLAPTAAGDEPWLSFLVWGDLNNDGKLDGVAIARQSAAEHQKSARFHRLYLGNGKGYFVAREPSGLEVGNCHNTLNAALADLDLDGRLDLALGNAYLDESKSYEAQPMRVFQGAGGDFKDVTDLWGFNSPGPPGAANGARPLYGVSAADLNGDGYPEILGAAYGRQWNTLWLRGPGRAFYSECAAKFAVDGDSIRHGQYSEATREKFRARQEERPDELPYRSNGNSFSIAPADFDGDGDIDLFDAEITHSWAGDSSDLSALLENRLETFSEPFFERWIDVLPAPDPQTGFAARPRGGLARDHSPQPPEKWNQGDLQAHWGDLDQDGRLDLILCESDYPNNHLRVFLQKTDKVFTESENELGLDWPNCPGIALGDYDRDGDLDVVATGSQTRWPEARPKPELSLWKNSAPGGFLWIRLVGDGKNCNTNAIGARVYLTDQHTNQTREVTGSYGHWGQQSQPGEVHFGLGASKGPLKVRIVWPNRARSETLIDDVPRDGWLVVNQARGVRASMTTFDAKAYLKD